MTLVIMACQRSRFALRGARSAKLEPLGYEFDQGFLTPLKWLSNALKTLAILRGDRTVLVGWYHLNVFSSSIKNHTYYTNRLKWYQPTSTVRPRTNARRSTERSLLIALFVQAIEKSYQQAQQLPRSCHRPTLWGTHIYFCISLWFSLLLKTYCG